MANKTGHIGKVIPVAPTPTFHHVDDTQIHKHRRKELLEKYPDLADLRKPYLPSALYVIGIVAAQHFIGVKAAELQLGGLAVFLLAYTIGATLVHAMWVLIHDLTHDAVFESKFLNHIFHLPANLPIIFPAAFGFRHYHRLHHAYLNEKYNDPDMPGPLEAKIFGNSAIGKAIWLCFFGLIQSIRVHRYHGRLDLPTVAQWATQIAYVYYLVTQHSWQCIVYMFVSSLFAIGLHPLGARWVSEHYNTHEGQETYSYYGVLNKVSFNIGYHNEHHDLPRVPWKRLPDVSARAPEYYSSLVEHPSYTKMLFDFIFNPRFTLESRVIHPSYTAICDHTNTQDRDDVKARLSESNKTK